MSDNKPNTMSSGSPYDDVYRTMITDCPNLIIPVVNEVFQKNIREDTEIIALQNEVFLYRQDGNLLERITDSNLLIESTRYHIECQSSIDNTMLIRIFEYDSQIALQDSELTDNILTVSFPRTAVMYLRHNSNTPDIMTIHIEVPGDTCSYEVPVMKVSLYTVDEIFKKKLYFLIPFHIFAYEHLFEEYDKNDAKLEKLTQIYEDIIERLHKCAKQGQITEYIKRTIIDMSKQVLQHISKKYSNVREGIGEIMGGQVLEYEAKDILRRGIAQGYAEGQVEKLLTQIRKKLTKGKNLEEIADDLEESVETIESLIKEYHLV